MANVYPLDHDSDDSGTVRVPAPHKDRSAIVVQLHGGGEYDPDTDTVQVESPEGDVTVSFGQPNPEPKDSKFGDNLSEHLSDSTLTSISERLMAGIEADEQSRAEWLENAARGIGLLGLELKAQQGASAGAAQTPAEGTSKVDHPLLLEAVLRFQANARGELLPADGPVKVRNDGGGSPLASLPSEALEPPPNTSTPARIDSIHRPPPRTTATWGITGPELNRLSGAVDFMEQRRHSSSRRASLWLLTTDGDTPRSLIADIWKRVTRLQGACRLHCFSVTTFESRGGIHAHIIFIGIPEIAQKLKTSKQFGDIIHVCRVTDSNGLFKYLIKERTSQAGYRREHKLGGRLRGSHRLEGGGDRVRLSRALERDAIDAGYIEPWQHTNAKRKPDGSYGRDKGSERQQSPSRGRK
jgi:hypothetical protein